MTYLESVPSRCWSSRTNTSLSFINLITTSLDSFTLLLVDVVTPSPALVSSTPPGSASSSGAEVSIARSTTEVAVACSGADN
eukprot:CAMPEP_0119467462 /NCGR_PEP_ID=MMETSP1344-20130328/1640_1 /TAXON_ID=236787 /ORGANISM="Florenciella parvula, Strain CCMP2471" /LENGTH=81 /DNA_ID=CAMNT_0007499831 /DNA_START=284 /DNA_END=526 /DNA_ORIENTATION=-